MARSARLTTGIRSAPTTEIYTRCCDPAGDVAATRFRVRSSSPFELPAQCTMVPAPSAAAWIPSPVVKSPVTNSMPSTVVWPRRLSTRTSQPASRRSGTRCCPSVPVPPVTRMGAFMIRPPLCKVSIRVYPVDEIGPLRVTGSGGKTQPLAPCVGELGGAADVQCEPHTAVGVHHAGDDVQRLSGQVEQQAGLAV